MPSSNRPSGLFEELPARPGAGVGVFWTTGAAGAFCDVGAGVPCPCGAELFGIMKNQTAATITMTTITTHIIIFAVLDIIMNSRIFFRPF